MRLFVFLLFISTILKSQQADSLLENILAIDSDTERVNQLYKRGFSLRNYDPGLAFKYGRICEQMAANLSSKKHLAKSYNLMGVLYYKKGDFTNAINYHKQALKIREDYSDMLGMALSQTNLGNIYVDLKLFALAERYHMQALAIYRNLNDRSREANCLINLGALKQHMELQDEAFNYYKQAFTIGEELHDYDIRSICLNNMGIVFYKKGEYEKAIAYHYDALKLKQLMDNNVEMADSYLNLASNYIKLEQYEKALSTLNEGDRLSKKYDYYEARQEAMKIYAEFYEVTGDYESAYNYLQSFYRSRDSLITKETQELQILDLETQDSPANETSSLNNRWLLVLTFCLCVLVPFYLIRFKR